MPRRKTTLKERLEGEAEAAAAQSIQGEDGAERPYSPDEAVTVTVTRGDGTVISERAQSVKHLMFKSEWEHKYCYDCLHESVDHYEGEACEECAKLVEKGTIPADLACPVWVWHETALHGQFMVMGREVSLSGTFGVASQGRMSRAFWETLRFGAHFKVLVDCQVVGDGFKPLMDKGDIIGAIESRKGKVERGIISLGDTPAEQIDELPLFATRKDMLLAEKDKRIDDLELGRLGLLKTNGQIGVALVEAMSHLTELRQAYEADRTLLAEVQDQLLVFDAVANPETATARQRIKDEHYAHVMKFDHLFTDVEAWEKKFEDEAQADGDDSTAEPV